MVEPARSADVGYVRLLDWPLYRNDKPSYNDMEQNKLTNCPLGSWLAALAHTAKGQVFITTKLVKEIKNKPVEIALSSNADSVPESQKKFGNKIKANRHFEVILNGKTYSVSSAFYTDDADSGWNLTYMQSPTKVLWPCLVEKAYAKRLEKSAGRGDYVYLKDLNDPVAVWKDLTGLTPTILTVAAIKDSKLNAIVGQAQGVPTIAASKKVLPPKEQDVMDWHGYTVLGRSKIKKGRIHLWDQYNQEHLHLTYRRFRAAFQAVLYGLPPTTTP